MNSLREWFSYFIRDLKGINVALMREGDFDADLSYFITICADKTINHPDWSLLAGRFSMLQLKETSGKSFSETTLLCSKQLDAGYLEFVKANSEVLDSLIVDERNFNFDLIAVDTLKKSYLLKRKEIVSDESGGKTVESINIIITEEPEQMYLRVATFLWFPNLEKIKKCYTSLSLHKYIHASPTLFNCGLRRPQLASCFLLHIDDSIDSITKNWKDCAIISKNSGGIGINLSAIRHSEIGETGKSRGIVPLIKVVERICEYVDQGGKRKGSCACYLSDWHVDFMSFIDLKKKIGDEKLRAKDLFYSAWISDIFMERVVSDGMWSFFCPNKAKGLSETWGTEFENLYLKYESEGKYEKQLPARTVFFELMKAQIETGVPYLLFRDAINRKSMQSNIGIIRSSNLCAEITLHTSEKEIASCNLSNICLNAFVIKNEEGEVKYDFEALGEAAYELTENMNQVIDRNFYPHEIPEIKYSNMKNRPIGIGVQGFSDAIAMMDMTWDSEEALELNRKIFETIYYNSVKSSVDQAHALHEENVEAHKKEVDMLTSLIEMMRKQTPTVHQQFDAFRANLEDRLKTLQIEGPKPGWYDAFVDSPYSRGKFQFDLWVDEKMERFCMSNTTATKAREIDVEQLKKAKENTFITPGRYDWETLRTKMVKYGIRNSTLIAIMPTASTAHINGNNECIEPFNANVGMRTLLSGQFVVFNKHLVSDLERLGVWSKDIANKLIEGDGSIQDIEVPESIKRGPLKEIKEARFNYIKRKYRTVYELPQKILLDMSIARSPFICQTSSSNCFMGRPSISRLYSYHLCAWRGGWKTGMYYLRSQPPSKARNIVVSGSGGAGGDGCLACQ